MNKGAGAGAGAGAGEEEDPAGRPAGRQAGQCAVLWCAAAGQRGARGGGGRGRPHP
eukprot:SAG22_NODE_724_length_7634_cov_11.669808_5_plen_56_part_00